MQNIWRHNNWIKGMGTTRQNLNMADLLSRRYINRLNELTYVTLGVGRYTTKSATPQCICI